MKLEEKMRQIGLNISYYRKYRNLTQMQLAEEVNLSSCYISQIERGLVKKSVSLPVLISIAEALNVEVGKLFEFRD
jgi:transcriptional regulator with XRE-family HTH domain